MNQRSNAEAWRLPGVLNYFETERTTSAQVYPSEWFFLKDTLREGVNVLDIGCAKGGFATVLSEHVKDFSYTGLDISSDMIAAARTNHADSEFHLMEEGDFSLLEDRTFDLVLALGILHLHESWRETLAAAWHHTRGALIFDTREISAPSIEDKETSFFRMDFGGGDKEHSETTLPYNLINTGEAFSLIEKIGANAKAIKHYGYMHAVSDSAQCPVEKVMFNTWCLERKC